MMTGAPQTKILGILSDTHGQLPQSAFAALADCDFIIHAGDIGGPDILAQLKSLAPVYAVLGNNDYDEYGSEVQKFSQPVIEGVRFLVAHYPHDILASLKGVGFLQPGDPLPQICVHGHIHLPRILTGGEASCAQAIICPGSVTYPRSGSQPSVAKLSLSAGHVADMRLEEI